MKKIILFLIYSSCYVVFSQQQQNFSLQWEASRKMSTESFSIEVPAFNKEYFNFNLEKGLHFVSQWTVSNNVNESSVTVSQISYAPISKNELKDLNPKTIPSQLNFSLKNASGRDKKFAIFQMSPIIKEANGTYKKITSFQINYISGAASNRISSVNKISKTTAVSNSVLNTGEWYRFYVDTTGVFKLSKSFLQRLGVKVNEVDPRTIKLFGNGGRMIPYSNAIWQSFDVEENAIKFVGEEDGVFNNEDHILFYAQGPKGYNEESNTHINCYTDKTYYYINVGFGTGKRMQSMALPSGDVDLVINTFEDYKFHEIDTYNIAFLGRRWFGDRFDVETEKTFNFDFPDLVITEPVRFRVVVASTAETATSMGVSVNGDAPRLINIALASDSNLANGAEFNGTSHVNTSKIAFKLNYNKGSNPSAVGYLDYISVEATRALKFNNKQFQFKNSLVKEALKNNLVEEAPVIAEYVISNAAKVSEVWDVTDIYNVSSTMNADANSEFSFKAAMGEVKSYVAVTAFDYFEPKFDSKTTVSNQDIKGRVFNDGPVDYIIVTPNNMLTQAERLAQINRNQYGLNVKVYTLNEIYNEFSTGNQDIGAIRNLVKYVYDNAGFSTNRIKYLCLFGDASFDYKDRIPNNTNIVPSWYSLNSFSLTSSFVSDDFYGMMDNEEGTMDNEEGTMETSDKLDIAVGRILADTPQRAKEMVDKVEAYYAKEALGSWRNNFVVVSDDVDKEIDGELQKTTDELGDAIKDSKPFMNVIKIHSDAYQQETSAGGNRYPQVNTALANAIDNGALVINYFGHGGVDGLAQERILSKPNIEAFRNFNKFNCFVTVTCEFTKFDNPYRETAGEFAYWNKEAGSIALITTTRQIFVNVGINFNKALNDNLFLSDDVNSEYPSMAEALRQTKVTNPNDQNKLIFFIGDPAMKLAFPKSKIQLTEINDVPIAQSTDTLKALSYTKLAGNVTDVSGNLLSNYNGTLSVSIYDKDIARETLANDGIRYCLSYETINGESRCKEFGELIKRKFNTLGEIIFRGQASVKAGIFEFDFVVPKDINIPLGDGKISFYSQKDDFLEDQAGANTLKIGGVNEDAAPDTTVPEITLYMNDEYFVSGGITNESPTLLAKLFDENGINTASGIGHDIVAILDGDETNPYILNDYYQTEVDKYTNGEVSFPFRDLKPGLHTLTLKAWDVYNNSSTAEIQFMVYDKDEALVINNVLNYPNPFVNYTEFWFNHNSSTPLNVSVQIFTVSGKLVKTLNGQTKGGAITNSSLSRDLIWDGRDDFGERIGKGVYIYKLTVKSDLLNKKTEKIEKLVIL